MGVEAQKMWDDFKEANPDTKLTLDHTGAEINSIFVHSVQSNKSDEHTQQLKDWIKEAHPKSRVGVGVMKYDNWVVDSNPEQRVEIIFNPEILNAPVKEDTDDSRGTTDRED